MLTAITKSYLRAGTTGIIRETKSWWWDLTLSCGHRAERRVRFDGYGTARSNILPPPKKIKCLICRNQYVKFAKKIT